MAYIFLFDVAIIYWFYANRSWMFHIMLDTLYYHGMCNAIKEFLLQRYFNKVSLYHFGLACFQLFYNLRLLEWNPCFAHGYICVNCFTMVNSTCYIEIVRLEASGIHMLLYNIFRLSDMIMDMAVFSGKKT
jgi:hypothetical protein